PGTSVPASITFTRSFLDTGRYNSTVTSCNRETDRGPDTIRISSCHLSRIRGSGLPARPLRLHRRAVTRAPTPPGLRPPPPPRGAGALMAIGPGRGGLAPLPGPD